MKNVVSYKRELTVCGVNKEKVGPVSVFPLSSFSSR